MASKVTIARWRDGLTRIFGLKGEGQGVTCIDDVMPVAPLWDPADEEHHFERGERLWGVGGPVGAVAAQYGDFTISNPPNTGSVVVVEYLAAHVIAAGPLMQLRAYLAVGVAGSGCPLLDTRHTRGIAGLSPSANYAIGSTAGAPGYPFLAHTAIPADGSTQVWACPVVLLPGTALWVRATTANQAYEISAHGYERHAEPAELR